MGRLTDHDTVYGPLTFGKTDSKMLGLTYSTGSWTEDDEGGSNHLTGYFFGMAFRVMFPCLIKPLEVKIYPKSWDEATKKRLGRDYYFEYTHKEYGFIALDESISVSYGVQPKYDSWTAGSNVKSRRRSFSIPWRSYHLTMNRLYDGEGKLVWSSTFDKKDSQRNRDEVDLTRANMQYRGFLVRDADGTVVRALVHVTEMQWRRGYGRLQWMWGFLPGIHRKSIEIEFQQEMGPRKGSWKGGLIALGFEMLQDESITDAFKRFVQDKSESDRDLRGLRYVSELGLVRKQEAPTQKARAAN